MNRTRRGSCVCGAIAFEADIDLSMGTSKCNCTTCWKRRLWTVTVAPSAFRLAAGQDIAMDGARGGPCGRCGLVAFYISATDGWDVDGKSGDQVSISVAALDDLPIAELLAAPVHYLDGRSDAWHERPAETRHL